MKHGKQFLSCFLALTICLSALMVPASAAEPETTVDDTVVIESDTWTPDSLVVNIGATEDAISVTWYDTTATPGTLTFGGKDYTASVEEADKTGYYINRVSVSDLAASTTYTYTIASGDGVQVSEDYTYTTTAFGDGESFSFVAVGDPQIGSSGSVTSDTEGWANTLAAIEADGTDYSFIFSLGDQINSYYTTDSSNLDSVEEEYSGFLSAYSTLSSTIPLATLMGNHDAGSNTTLYTNHFSMPNTTSYGQSISDMYTSSEAVSTDGAGDYYYTYNGVLFMVLNTSNLSIAEHKQFLEETLAANPDATWTVVAFHKSIYSVASHVTEDEINTLRNGLSPIFVDLDIDLVLQGHDHVYARSYVMNGSTGMNAVVTDEVETDIYNPDGVIYVTLNSASGSKYYNITNEAFTYTAVQNQEKTPNYTSVTVTDSTLTLTTYRSNDSSVVDTFTIHKDGNASTADDYDITTEITGTGDVTASDSATAGENVRVSAEAAENYELASITVVNDTTGESTVLTDGSANRDGSYEFTMPASSVTVTVLFEHTVCATEDYTDNLPYTYYHDAVDVMVSEGLMIGTDIGVFSPDISVSRSMTVMVLYRLAGSPEYTGTADYTDVPADSYYATAAAWAQKNGLMIGYNGKFRPDDAVTREEMVTVLYRYAVLTGMDTTSIQELTAYTDASEVSDWALEAMQWALGTGLVKGVSATSLDPAGDTLRRDFALLVYRFEHELS